MFLSRFGIEFISYVLSIGGIKIKKTIGDYQKMRKILENSELFVPDQEVENAMKRKIDQARKARDTLGGVFEVRVRGIPPGLGSHIQWDRKLDGRIAQALMSIQAVKGVEIGSGFGATEKLGSQVHDPIILSDGKMMRSSNNAGGIEGGISNGEEIVVRAAMKPISTLLEPLPSVNLQTGKAEPAMVERSDICAVPAASVVGECAVAIEIAKAFLEKFGGDNISETERNYNDYLATIKKEFGWEISEKKRKERERR
jgi:chorismate synthase